MTAQGELYVYTAEGSQEFIRGMAVVNATPNLMSRLMAMGHLIPAIRSLIPLPFSEMEQAEWAVLVRKLGVVLQNMNGMNCNLRLLPQTLRSKVDEVVRDCGYHMHSPFLQSHAMNEDVH